MAKKSSANIGFEKKLWAAADKLRGSMDAADYKHVVLGLIFLKYISDAFNKRRDEIKNDSDLGKDFLEDRDAYTMKNVFWVPQDARWEVLQSNAKKPEIGKIVDDAMLAIEKANPKLKGVLPKNYARQQLNKRVLGELIDLFSTIDLQEKNGSKDVLGRVYEYFIGKFANAEGKGGGEFYTPECVVKLLVKMIEPYKGRVFDPCCGSGGMFVQSDKFVKEHGGKIRDLSIYGQEYNYNTWQLATMNLAIRGIEAKIEHGDSFHNDHHKDLKADFILANPPFNSSDWGGERLKDDVRWKYGMPPVNNANYAWIQHFIHHLAPSGIAGFVLANQALVSKTKSEVDIRKDIIQADLIDCIISLPDKLFYTTPIPASLWFIARNKNDGKYRDRRNEILFIDAEKLFKSVSRTANEMRDVDIQKIAETYHSWKSKEQKYDDEPGFCKSVSTSDVVQEEYSLFPAQFVGFKHEIKKYSEKEVKDIGDEAWERYKKSIEQLTSTYKALSSLFQEKNNIQLPTPIDYEEVNIGEVLEPCDERLGERQEPEILTLTETAGLMLQKDRFAKRVATKNTKKYRVLHKTDIVYNPYLLWAGAIDQCWIVDMGIISPAYEVFKVREEYNPTLIGKIIKSKLLLKMYNGISVGTIKRRRRAPVEKFLKLKIVIPSKKDQQKFSEYSNTMQNAKVNIKNVETSLIDFLDVLSKIWINGIK